MENRVDRPHILIADHAPSHRKLMDALLADLPYNVVCVGDGKTALEHLRACTPDLLILEVDLPDLSGLDVCGRVRGVRRLAGVPVLLVSSRPRASVEPQMAWVRAEAVLEKPLRMATFKDTVRDLLAVPAELVA